jgi:NAD(P)-dependent dehydrogenase (short-subunit alcohol dehydrogenase family)
VMLGMKHAIPLMRARGGGSIINTASIAGLEAGWGPVAYSTAKGAVIHLTRVAAAQHGVEKIRINAICPGLIATSIFGASIGMPPQVADQMAARVAEVAAKFQPIAKAGMPEDIARACLYLASDASGFVTGTHLVVDGGVTTGDRHAWDPETVSPILQLIGFSAEQIQEIMAQRTATAPG